ncbi:MAG: patatin-like phospholipase family protein [Patescibacteria group bacterium]|nr:patatin-like phospholipase family protein [Patescibacteria group bacterium]MDD5715576.1 patatin-like phospholipase family protein [Patescibacteria group bacterium]
MERDVIVISEGGAMLGVFGAGVVTAFHEANLYPRIHSIYGTSAGAHNAAYFLAAWKNPPQARLGASIYYEDLIGRNFIKPQNFFRYLVDITIHRFRKSHPIHHLIDIDYLEQVESSQKRLDVAAIKEQPIPFNVAVYDMQERQARYSDGTAGTLRALKASASSPPFYASPVRLAGRDYLDGGYVRSKADLRLIADNPDKKVVYIINNRKTILNTLQALPFEILQMFLLAILFGFRIACQPLRAFFCFINASRLSKYPNAIVVQNELPHSHSTTNRAKLLELYQHGIEQGKRALEKLG